MSTQIRAVERAARVLKVLSEDSDGMGVTEVAQRVQLGKSTTHRLLSSLSEADLVRVRPSSRRYTLGYGLLRLTAEWLNRIDVRTLALPHLRALRERSRETVSLNLKDGLERVAVERLDTSHEIRFVVDLGRPLPLHVGAAGKAMLAYMSEDEVGAAFDAAGLEARQRRKIGRDLAEIRQLGTAHTIGERVSGAGSVSAPIFSHEGLVVASVSVLCLESRLQKSVVKTLRHMCRTTAQAISGDLGWRGAGKLRNKPPPAGR
ncbi:MAG TPA: IclR family transcriptional regulator [Alphaproteobacteria bacterium]|jgi:DNA-binding IclR family transcriptional regulator|nr:IclR family transcriptional regulator [Alphaproteobacteria bacterium]